MSEEKEIEVKTDIGVVKVDPDTKEILVDGKPLKGLTQSYTLLDLLVKDLTIDREIIKSARENHTAIKGWLAGIANIEVREMFRLYIEDNARRDDATASQRELQLNTLGKMQKLWMRTQQQQPTPADPATETKSVSSMDSASSVVDATEQEKSPEPASN